MTILRVAPATLLTSALVLVLLTGCAPVSSSAPPANASSAPVASNATHGAVARRAVPAAATGLVDDASWAIADRLTAPTYTTDTTAAVVSGLAAAGIGTYADASSQGPDQPVAGSASPFHLLDFQAHALAVGVWADSRFSGTELDTVVPLPAGLSGMPTTSDLLAAYVAAADSPGGSLSRALMAGQDLLHPADLRFPALVLVLFASDLATDGGRVADGVPHAGGRSEDATLARFDMGSLSASPAAAHLELAAAVGVCTSAATWIDNAISSLFSALKLATPSSVPGAIIASVWNWLVSKAESLVRGLLSSVTDAVLATVRSIAAAVAAVSVQIASILPYALKVTATGDGGDSTFRLGKAPLSGTFTLVVTAGDLPEWPPVLADCAAVAKVALADFHAKDVALTWGPLQAPGDPKLAPIGSARNDDRTDASGQATWGFTTSVDPGDPTGEEQAQVDSMPVSIHRPEVEAARERVTEALLGFIPPLLKQFVAAVFKPYADDLQARLNAMLDARGSGTTDIIFHSEASPKPSTLTSPGPSGACGANPVIPGTYTGTTASSFSETIDEGAAFGGVVATTSGTGHATVIVAADGSLSGTWDLVQHEVFDETASVDGTPMLKDHRVATYTMTNGTVSGTACVMGLSYGSIVVNSCVDSLKGDCSDEPMSTGSSPVPLGMGPPSSVTAGGVTWTSHRSDDGAATVKSDLTVTVARP